MRNDFDILKPVGESDGTAFTFRDLTSLLFKWHRVILFCFVTGTILVALGLYLLPPTYVAEGKVLVKTEQLGNPSMFSGISAYREPMESDPVIRKLETEMEMLSTRELSERVVRKLNLSYEQVYRKPLTVLLRPVSDLLDRIKTHFLGYPEDPDTYGQKATVKEFNASLLIAPLKSKSAETTSNMIGVSLKATNAATAQAALQTLLEEYVQQAVEENGRLANEAHRLVEQNLALASAELEAAREARRKFIAERGTTISGGYATALPTNDQESKSELAGEETNVAAHSTAGGLKNRLINSELRLIELRQVYRDNSSNIKQLKTSIAELKARIKAELKAQAEGEKTLASLDMEARAAAQRYLDLRRKLDQIALFLKLNPAQTYNRQIAEPPMRPKSSEWKKTILVGGLGSLVSLMLGLGIAGYREYTDHRLSSADALKAHLNLTPLAVIAYLDGPRERGGPLLRDTIKSFYALTMRLFSMLGKRRPDSACHSVLVTSACAAEGKTFVSRILAQRMAELSNNPVLLVDANIERPALHERFGTANGRGFSDCLAAGGATDVEIHDTPQPRLKLMTAGNTPMPGLLFKHQAYQAFLSHYSGRFGVIVLDGNLLGASGCLPHQSDGIILVVDSSRTRREVVQGVLDQAGIEEARFLGAVLNKRIQYIPRALYRHF